MKTFIGTGVGQPEAAVHQAVQGLTSPKVQFFLWLLIEHFKETASRLKELFPDTPCIGTIGTKLVNGQVNDSGLAVLGFFPDVKIRCGIITEASRCPVAGTTQLLKQIAEISPGTDDTVCVEYCTGSEEKLVTTFTSCLETKGIHLAAAGSARCPRTRRGPVPPPAGCPAPAWRHRFRCPGRQTSGRCI